MASDEKKEDNQVLPKEFTIANGTPKKCPLAVPETTENEEDVGDDVQLTPAKKNERSVPLGIVNKGMSGLDEVEPLHYSAIDLSEKGEKRTPVKIGTPQKQDSDNCSVASGERRTTDSPSRSSLQKFKLRHNKINSVDSDSGSIRENGSPHLGRDGSKNYDKIKDEDPNNANAWMGVEEKTKDAEKMVDKPDGTGLDEVDLDRLSLWSLYMERNFRYYFQHPYLRLFIAYLVTFCNFLIYAEDPVAHSQKECSIPLIGNDFAFVCTRYPKNAWSLLKVLLWLAGILVGTIVGKLICHRLLFNKLLKLKMFMDDAGSWMTMFLTTLVSLFLFSLVYNLFLMIGGDSTDAYRITALMGIRNDSFMKAAACGTWCGDFFTAWMVTDVMLQDKLYPNWAKGARKWWNRGYNRIILFWIIVVVTSFVVVVVISTDWILWDKLNRDFLPSNEMARSFLASFILVMDLLIVMQDWDFPHFMNNFDIKLPGLNTASYSINLPKYFKREDWAIHITGKWFNYGIIFIVMLLDLNMWKNQIFYEPYAYGQYTGPHGKVFTVHNQTQLATFNESYLSYDWRVNNTNPETNETYIMEDTYMNSRYYGITLPVKSTAFVPNIAAAIVFGVLVWLFGRRKPTETDPYAGRLKRRKRRKRKRSQLGRGSFRLSQMKVFKNEGPAVIFDGKDYVSKQQDGQYPLNYDP